MLQLGLLRVVTRSGSLFKKQRIKAKNVFVPTRSSWCSSVLCLANCAFRILVEFWNVGPDIPVMVQKLNVCLRMQSFLWPFSFCWGFVWPLSFLILLSLSFAWTIYFVITTSGMPQFFFLSLLHRFWLNGLLFWEIMTAYS